MGTSVVKCVQRNAPACTPQALLTHFVALDHPLLSDVPEDESLVDEGAGEFAHFISFGPIVADLVVRGRVRPSNVMPGITLLIRPSVYNILHDLGVEALSTGIR